MIVKLVFLEETDDIGIYSVCKQDDAGQFMTHEYLDFLKRMQLDSKKNRQLIQIKKFIVQMKTESDINKYVKREEEFARIPPDEFRFFDSDGETDWGLRLYCIPVNNENIILLNGDLKTHISPLQCSNCKEHFLFARQVAKAFFTDWRVNGKITVEQNVINPTDEELDEILLKL